jgi:hypothetical protein
MTSVHVRARPRNPLRWLDTWITRRLDLVLAPVFEAMTADRLRREIDDWLHRAAV